MTKTHTSHAAQIWKTALFLLCASMTQAQDKPGRLHLYAGAGAAVPFGALADRSDLGLHG